jgi:hypothetical protein
MKRLILRSGGQTGVDRAALDVAIAKQIPYCGFCPRDGWAEDLPVPPGLLAKYPRLTETPSAAPEQRTAWNVRDSHATLLIANGSSLDASRGSFFTQTCAELIFLRPCHVVDLSAEGFLRLARDWLDRAIHLAGPGPFILNVAGPRESESPGIYRAALDFLTELVNDDVSRSGGAASSSA